MGLLKPLPEEQVEEADALDRIDLRSGRKQGLKTGLWAGRAVNIPGPFMRQLYDVAFLTGHGIVGGEVLEEAVMTENSTSDGQ